MRSFMPHDEYLTARMAHQRRECPKIATAITIICDRIIKEWDTSVAHGVLDISPRGRVCGLYHKHVRVEVCYTLAHPAKPESYCDSVTSISINNTEINTAKEMASHRTDKITHGVYTTGRINRKNEILKKIKV